MKVNLKCVKAPNKPCLYTVGRVYENVEIMPRDKLGGLLSIHNDNGRNDYRGYKFNQEKNLYFGGYVFKISLIQKGVNDE